MAGHKVWPAAGARNLLTAQQATGGDVEGSTKGFANYSPNRATVTYTTAAAYSGAGCIEVACIAAGQIGVYLDPPLPVDGGAAYTITAAAMAAVSPQPLTFRAYWKRADGSACNPAYAEHGPPEFASVPMTGWVIGTATMTAPADAATARLLLLASSGAGVGDIFYADRFGWWAGTGGDWTMP
jgi:hypothetical protein